MSMQTPTREKRTELPTNSRGVLGIDSEGFCHVILRDEHRVVRLDETGIERTTDLGDQTDVRYRAWVESQVGWKTRETLFTVDLHGILGGDAE